MALVPVHGKATKILLSTYDLSTFFKDATHPVTVDTPESTTFGAAAKTYAAGLPGVSASLTGFFDASTSASEDPVLGALVGINSDTPYTVGFSGLANGSQTLLGNMLASSYQLHSPVAGLNEITLALQADGVMRSGVSLHDLAAETGSVSTTGVNNTYPTGPQAISTASWGASVATYTTGTIPHGFVTGQTVVIAGITPSGYNGTFVIASTPTSTTFTVAMTANPGAYSSGGTALVYLTGGLVAHLHVTADTMSGGTGLTFAVQHSVDNVTFATLATFNVPVGTLSAQRLVVAAGTAINQYLRINFQVNGASGSVTWHASAART